MTMLISNDFRTAFRRFAVRFLITFTSLMLASASFAQTDEKSLLFSYTESLGQAFQYASQAGQDKQAASREIQEAREAFYSRLDQGVRGTPEEDRFATILLAKDIMYLSLYGSEGMESSRQRVSQIEQLTGGALDGGIGNGPFAAWVSSVRNELGYDSEGSIMFPPPSESAFINAIKASGATYLDYKRIRDIEEFSNWRSVRTKIAPIATSKSEIIANYIDYVLDPALSEGLLRQSVADQKILQQAGEMWKSQVRTIINECENTELTLDNSASYLKKRGLKPDQINNFLVEQKSHIYASDEERSAALAKAISQAILSAYPTADPSSSLYFPENIEHLAKEFVVEELRAAKSHSSDISISRKASSCVIMPDSPFPIEFESYDDVRTLIVDHKLEYKPSFPRFPFIYIGAPV